MRKLSTGHDSTLGNWKILSAIAFGEDSKQVKFFQDRIDTSSKGENEEVIVDEQQLILTLVNM